MRVVVTGLGAITPIGNTVDEFWNNAKKGTIGIDKITSFDTSDFKVSVAGEVKDFDCSNYIERKSAKRMDRFSQFAVVAAKQALEDSKLDIEKEDKFRLGVSVGSGIGGIDLIEKEVTRMNEKGPNKIYPLSVPLVLGNMASANIAKEIGFCGKCIDVVTACATGTNSIGEAYRSIKDGELDVVIAGGVDSPICKIAVAGFQELSALTKESNPKRASIPFDKDRSGFVIGEGAGILILENLEHAKKRNAKIYAEIIGYGATCDAYHITAPREDGKIAGMAMKFAMQDAKIKPEDIDYINAHGTSTYYNDLTETRAIKFAMGEEARRIKINSTKSMTGHLLGASGAVELIVCIKSIQDSYIHQTIGLAEEDPECDLDYCKGKGINMPVNIALSNSMGFGGHNASVIVKKYMDKDL